MYISIKCLAALLLLSFGIIFRFLFEISFSFSFSSYHIVYSVFSIYALAKEPHTIRYQTIRHDTIRCVCALFCCWAFCVFLSLSFIFFYCIFPFHRLCLTLSDCLFQASAFGDIWHSFPFYIAQLSANTYIYSVYGFLLCCLFGITGIKVKTKPGKTRQASQQPSNQQQQHEKIKRTKHTPYSEMQQQQHEQLQQKQHQ